MRIIAGEFRGRKLIAPGSDSTRPITDRAKQSLFDLLTPLINGAAVYDCFAGTGSLGLESLSRGADRVVFFERDRQAVARLRQNVEQLGVAGRTKIVAGDLFKWFEPTTMAADRAGLVFLDPPYRFLIEQPQRIAALARNLAAYHLADGGLVIFRHDAKDHLDLPCLARYDRREYGSMAIELLRRAS